MKKKQYTNMKWERRRYGWKEWRRGKGAWAAHIVTSGPEQQQIICELWYHGKTRQELDDIGRLIESAPDLLAACRLASGLLKNLRAAGMLSDISPGVCEMYKCAERQLNAQISAASPRSEEVDHGDS
jgi:hypothetical protein